MTTGSGTAANPFVLARMRWPGFTTPDGNVLAVAGPDPTGLTGQVFTPGGNLRPLTHGAPHEFIRLRSGGDGFFFLQAVLFHEQVPFSLCV
jgi:hypothetical protein